MILADPGRVKHERKKILRMKRLAEAGKITKHDVDMHFKAWKSSVRYGNSKNLIRRMNAWYAELWNKGG